MGQCGELGEPDAGQRQDFVGTDGAALNAAQHEGRQGAGGGWFI
jgi:hypothetical protein